jgi:hypothetical protein
MAGQKLLNRFAKCEDIVILHLLHPKVDRIVATTFAAKKFDLKYNLFFLS